VPYAFLTSLAFSDKQWMLLSKMIKQHKQTTIYQFTALI